MSEQQAPNLRLDENSIKDYATADAKLDNMSDSFQAFRARLPMLAQSVASAHGALLDEINVNPEYNDEVAGKLRAAVEDFKGSW